MNIKRIKQFYWGINARINKEDVKFIDNYLTTEEKILFYKLSKAEQKHCIRVTKDIIKTSVQYKDINIERLIKAGLLHDIGKTNCKLNVIDKSIIVISDKITSGNIKCFSKFRKVDTYYNHGTIGYNILKAQIKDEKLLNLIANHHKENLKMDQEMELLKLCDDRN